MTRILMAIAAVALMVMPITTTLAAMEPSNEPTILDGTAWVLSALQGHELVQGSQVTLQFAGGTVQGRDGCNHYTGSYTADAESFRLSADVASTMMACPQPLMQQADAYLAAVKAARTARIDGDHLILSGADGTVLATLIAQNRSLPGSAWQVTAYNNGRQAVVSLLAGTTLTMAFGTDGTVTGSAGCNSYRAAFTTSGTDLKIGPIASTRKLCATPEGVMTQEAAFLNALGQGTVVRIDGDRLELRTADGALMVNATRKRDTSPP